MIGVGGLAAVLGLYWDDAWHTDVGRDSFFAPPHRLLYAGVMTLLVAAAWWTWDRWRVEGRAVLRDPVLVLPLVGATVTLGAAPVDELWHQLFGKDAVTWSPPHMVAVAGMFAFATGLYLAVQRTRDVPRIVPALVGAFVIAAAVAPVMEFETDVPQFPVVTYWPVLVGMLAFAFALIGRVSDRPWAATEAATAYMVLRLGVVLFLAPLGHSLPTVMPTVVSAWAFDLMRHRGLGPTLGAVAVTAATVSSHHVAHDWQPAGLSFSATDVFVGALAGAAFAWVVIATLVERREPAGRRPPWTALAAVVAVLTVGWPGPALAHDPGQGDRVAHVFLEASREGDLIRLLVTAADGTCDGWEPVRVFARRAGQTLEAALQRVEPCRLEGEVMVGKPGRWFVYAEVAVGMQLTEAWIPVEEGAHRKEAVLYRSQVKGARPFQVVAGAALYAIVLALFAGVAAVYRFSAPVDARRP